MLTVLVVLVGLWAGLLLWAGLAAWNKVARVDAIPTSNQPAAGKGTNVLLVGSDSRAGLTSAQAKALRTGGSNITGSRTDSIMVLHMPASGEPTLVSIPRDTYVQIPGHRANKINAAFAYGPQVLVQTVENVTGLRIEHYMEIGFGGFAGIVDSVGGVQMCLPKAMDDRFAHINLPAGCQNLTGANALGYVRSRHVDATSDLARVKRQREFLSALTKKVASPGNLLVPWRLKNIGESGAQGLAVEDGMHSWTALRILWTLKKIGNGGNSVAGPHREPPRTRPPQARPCSGTRRRRRHCSTPSTTTAPPTSPPSPASCRNVRALYRAHAPTTLWAFPQAVLLASATRHDGWTVGS